MSSMSPVVTAVLLTAAVALLTLPPRHLDPPMAVAPRAGHDPVCDAAVVYDLLQVALTAGTSLPRALDAVGRAIGTGPGRSLRDAARALELGSTWERAWDGHPLADILAPAWLDGADPTPMLQQAARTTRASRAGASRIAAARLTVQLVLPVGLCLLPAFVCIGVIPVLLSGGLSLLG